MKKYKAPKQVKTYASTGHGNLTAAKRGKAGIKYIVIHYTGGNASARNNCIYFSREGAKTQASADFFIEKDGTIYRYNANLRKRYSWHCGDGRGAYGITNSNSIGIEVVSDGRTNFTKQQITALGKLVKHLQWYFSIDREHVLRHYDASRKECPYRYRGGTEATQKRWVTLRNKITQ